MEEPYYEFCDAIILKASVPKWSFNLGFTLGRVKIFSLELYKSEYYLWLPIIKCWEKWSFEILFRLSCISNIFWNQQFSLWGTRQPFGEKKQVKKKHFKMQLKKFKVEKSTDIFTNRITKVHAMFPWNKITKQILQLGNKRRVFFIFVAVEEYVCIFLTVTAN